MAGRRTGIDLSPTAVDGFVFWTRNPGPFGQAFEAVAARGNPFMIQVTVTGYPRALEFNVLETGRAIDQIRALAERWGPRAVVWRYDPVVLSSLTGRDWHRANFARIASALKGPPTRWCSPSFSPTAKPRAIWTRRHRFTVSAGTTRRLTRSGMLADCRPSPECGMRRRSAPSRICWTCRAYPPPAVST